MDANAIKLVKAYIENFYEENPFVVRMGIGLDYMKEGEVGLKMAVEKRHTNFYDIAHGGAILSIADTAMGAACLTENKNVVTLSLTMNFIKAVPRGKCIWAVGRVVHNGSRTMVCEAKLYNEDDKVVASANGTFFVMGTPIAKDELKAHAARKEENAENHIMEDK